MSSQGEWCPLLTDAHVQCTRRGEVVALARCLECNWLLDLDRAAARPALRCAAASPLADGRDEPPTFRPVD